MSLALAATPAMSFDFQVRYDRPHYQILTWLIDAVLVLLIFMTCDDMCIYVYIYIYRYPSIPISTWLRYFDMFMRLS